MTETTLEAQKETTVALEKEDNKRPRRTFSPRIDIYETVDSIVLMANMPGVPDGNIDVTLEKNQLTISGKVDRETPEGYKAVYGEQYIGDYKRTFTLSDEVNRDEIEATLKNGVLRLVLAKAAIAQARQITVRAE